MYPWLLCSLAFGKDGKTRTNLGNLTVSPTASLPLSPFCLPSVSLPSSSNFRIRGRHWTESPGPRLMSNVDSGHRQHHLFLLCLLLSPHQKIFWSSSAYTEQPPLFRGSGDENMLSPRCENLGKPPDCSALDLFSGK